MFCSLKVNNLIPRNRDRQLSTMTEVEGTIVAFSLKKKLYLSLLLIECQILDRCRASTDLQVSMPTSGKKIFAKLFKNIILLYYLL
jgi:hypothetical protein